MGTSSHGHSNHKKQGHMTDFEKRVKHWQGCVVEREYNMSHNLTYRTCKRPEKPEAPEDFRKTLPLVTNEEFKAYKFEDFVLDFRRTYEKNSATWSAREKNFYANLKSLNQYRERVTTHGWNPGITMFLDYTDGDYLRMLGLRVDRSKAAEHRSAEQGHAAEALHIEVPDVVSVVDADAPLSVFVRDQGACGSCWAAAAMTALEGAMLRHPHVQALARTRASELKSPIATLATEAVVSCAVAPKGCGPTGGCGGASVEMAFDLVMRRGVPLAMEWPYTSGRTGKQDICDDGRFKAPFLVTLSGYKVLPRNDLQSLISSLYRLGHPVTVSVDATNWHYYAGGIYSDTDAGPGDFHVNHAAALVGFRKPCALGGYYLVKNSWGSWFGESGSVRLEMKQNEGQHCGWDERPPSGGKLCKSEAERIWVCGTCGILYNSVFPTGVHAQNTSQASHPR